MPLPASTTAPLPGLAPSWAAAAQGAWLWDAHGQRRLDMGCAAGAAWLGHADPDVERAVAAADPRAEACAQARLMARLPAAEAVRFATDPRRLLAHVEDACRRVAGRPHVLEVATLDAAAALAPRLAIGDVAGVVLAASALPKALVLAVRALTGAAGALLVFDETAMGLRQHHAGAQGLHGVRADLAVFGRAIANGRPVAVAAGARDLIAALPRLAPPTDAALAAVAATLHKAERAGAELAIAVRGAEIQAELAHALGDAGLDALARIEGDPSASRLRLDHPQAARLHRRFAAQLAAHGVHGGAECWPSLAHGDAEIDALLDAWRRALPTLARAAAEPCAPIRAAA